MWILKILGHHPGIVRMFDRYLDAQNCNELLFKDASHRNLQTYLHINYHLVDGKTRIKWCK
ncbi:kinase-like domain protein [Rutstroemia sp. NJR-2017a BVV2]|nr:kinase-like domain protein [Rutstroemia sp. NJR-2017a BVV2]